MKTKIKLVKKFIKNIQKYLFKAIAVSAIALLFSACESRSEKLYKQAYDKISANQFLDAIDLLESSSDIEKDPEKKTRALFEAARLLRFEIQDYNKALMHLKKIVLESSDEKIRLLSQEAIADIYFDNLQNYPQALKELLILEPLIKDEVKKESIRLKIAKCQFLTGNSKVALEYIQSFLPQLKDAKKNFLLLKAQILQSTQKLDESLLVYDEIYKLDIEYFKSENLFSAVSLVMEEKQDYKKAIEYVQSHEADFTDKNYYDLRLKRLREKLTNKPFSKGVRK